MGARATKKKGATKSAKAATKKNAKKKSSSKSATRKAASQPAKKKSKGASPRKSAKKKAASKKKAPSKTPKKATRAAARKKKISRKTAAAKTARRTRPTAAKLRPFREKLLAKERELLQTSAAYTDDTRDRLDDGTEDYIDYAVSSYAKEFMLSLTEMDRKQLRLVEDALRRIDRREYGACQNCGQFIPDPRLEVQPWAQYCVKCQELEERGLLEDRFHDADLDAEEFDDDDDEGTPASDDEDESDEDDESGGDDLETIDPSGLDDEDDD